MNILDHVNLKDKFAKTPAERQQLKELKAAYFRKIKVANHKLKLTNKQISSTFASKAVITT